jgi:hypothetical protein
MKRTMALLSLVVVLSVAAIAQAPKLKAACGACCGSSCNPACCQSGCAGCCK